MKAPATSILKLKFGLPLILAALFVSAGSAFSQAPPRSLYSDYKANRIGDIITIVLQENIAGSSSTDASNRSGTAGEASGGITGNLTKFLPLFGANAAVSYNSDDRFDASQSQLLRGTISARIEDIMPNGDLYVIGTRTNEINGELHSLSVKGYVRSNDVDTFNSVPSFRLANSEISYMKKDNFEQAKRRPGFVRKVLWVVLGAGLAAGAYFGTN